MKGGSSMRIKQIVAAALAAACVSACFATTFSLKASYGKDLENVFILSQYHTKIVC